jgi:hypothetical protein
VLPPEEPLELTCVGGELGLAVPRFGIGLQSVVTHVEADEQSNSIQPLYIPETNAQPENWPWLLMETPTAGSPGTEVGEKLIHDPTLDQA